MATAAELIAQVQVATTISELDAIEAQANGRVTVLNAVADRRMQLREQSPMTVTEATPATTTAEAPAEFQPPPGTQVSPPEVLALKPNSAEDATEGPHPQVSQTAYVTWTKPDGSTFLAPLSNTETYERKGFSKGAEEEIEDLVAYWAEKARPVAEPAAAPTGGEPSG